MDLPKPVGNKLRHGDTRLEQLSAVGFELALSGSTQEITPDSTRRLPPGFCPVEVAPAHLTNFFSVRQPSFLRCTENCIWDEWGEKGDRALPGKRRRGCRKRPAEIRKRLLSMCSITLKSGNLGSAR